jgi:RNA polymerase sigma-70 factor (ECF subfamily)
MMGEITLVQTATLPAAEEEISLVRAAQQDPVHFSTIYLRYLNPVYSYLLAQVWDAGEAQDLTAQVFLQALEDLPKYRPIRPFSAWLFTIARHRAADYFRHRSQLPLDEEINLPANSLDPLAEVINMNVWLTCNMP